VQPLVYIYLNLLLLHVKIGHVEEMSAVMLRMSTAWMQTVKLRNVQEVVFQNKVMVKLNVKIRNALNYNAVMKLVLQVPLIYVVFVQRIWQRNLMFAIINKDVLRMNVAYSHVLLILFHVVRLELQNRVQVVLFVLH
jgi:hypothetical protein